MDNTNPQTGGHEHPDTGKLVTVTIDSKSKDIKRGSYTESELKSALGVDASSKLDYDVNGQLTPVPDRLTIKGGEQFFSHVSTGSSS